MIIVKLTGGLGNQLFQYAAGRQLAILHNTELVLEDSFYLNPPNNTTLRHYELHNFNTIARRCSEQERKNLFFYTHPILKRLWRLNPSLGKFYFLHEGKIKHQNWLSTPNNTFLDGYWQSEKYFFNIKNEIHSELQVIPEMMPQDKNIFDKISVAINSVSLHVRRGDYVSHPSAHATHGICSLDYYKRSIQYIANQVENPVFFVFSDDSEWVINNLKIDYPHFFVTHNNTSTAFQDLRLMALCKHNIIANSSFSWWGAWLNQNKNNITIAPQKWFANSAQETINLIPTNWKKI